MLLDITMLGDSEGGTMNDWKKWLIGLLSAVGGALVEYVTNHVPF